MINTFLISFKLRTAYKANGFIYSLKQIPLIKRILPDSLYRLQWLKVLANIISIFIEIGAVFIGKALYLSLMFYAVLAEMMGEKGAPGAMAEGFLHIFLFLSLIGAFTNTNMFNPTKDKFYAIVLMRMNARVFALTNYTYFLLKIIVGFMPFTIIFGTMAGLPLVTCILLPFFVVAVKIPVIAWAIRDFQKTNKARNENVLGKGGWAAVAVLLVAAYLPVAFGYWVGSRVFFAVFAAAALVSIWSCKFIWQFRDFRRLYKDLLTQSPVLVSREKKQAQMQSTYLKKIEITADETSQKTGFKYFHELFVKRHRKILMKSANKTAVILLGILFVLCVVCLTNPAFAAVTNGVILVYLPYFLFIMYMINRGQVVTQAMFMNCDHSMLTYRFYRQPKAILGLFTQRVKSVAAINLLPAGVIAVGLPLLLYLTGGTSDPLNYVVLFTSILAMSVFFSVHHLVLYYLLQPYNVNLESKSATYSIANVITYFVCYFFIGKRIPILAFGTGILVFCVLYLLVALMLAYRYAPKTFKLR